MRDFLQKAFALTLGTSGLGFLMAHAALTNGCRSGASSDAQAPRNASPVPTMEAVVAVPVPTSSSAEPPPPSATASATQNASPERPKPRRYMGATKAPPMDFFREGLGADAAAPDEPAQREPADSNAQAR